MKSRHSFAAIHYTFCDRHLSKLAFYKTVISCLEDFDRILFMNCNLISDSKGVFQTFKIISIIQCFHFQENMGLQAPIQDSQANPVVLQFSPYLPQLVHGKSNSEEDLAVQYPLFFKILTDNYGTIDQVFSKLLRQITDLKTCNANSSKRASPLTQSVYRSSYF